MLELDGQLREPHGGRVTPVTLHAFADGELHVEGAGRSVRLAGRALRLAGRARDGSRALQLDDGAVVAIARSEALERWIERHRGGGEGLASARGRRIARTAGSLAATAIAIALIVRVAVPGIAWLAARAIPYSADQKLGAAALEAMDDSLVPSALSPARAARVRATFERVAAIARLAHPPALALRGGGELGANAFALPGGTVVVTDELVGLAEREDELAAVIAHELGHLAHRHGLRALLQALGIGALAAGALGDFDAAGIATAAPLLLQLQYSRGFEREADAFAAAVLAEAAIDADALGRMLARLEASQPAGADLLAYLSTHPPTAERRRALGAAARGDGRE